MKFHLSLNASDLARSIDFYRALLGVDPAKRKSDYAKFELEDPALVLSLVPASSAIGGTVNHVGLRVADSAALVRIQKRLEETGIPTKCEDGVACCYARQTKFWVTDPDRTLWEIYVLHEDLDEPGTASVPVVASAVSFAKNLPRPAVLWRHELGQPVPSRVPHDDNSVHEAHLEGTLNGDSGEAEVAALLADLHRVLRPGGTLRLRGLAGTRALNGGKLHLPGPAAAVRKVFAEAGPLELLRAAGFTEARYETFSERAHFTVDGIEMREVVIAARKPGHRPKAAAHVAVYQGPMSSVVDDYGNIYPRGERVRINVHDWQALRDGAGAASFLLLPPEGPAAP